MCTCVGHTLILCRYVCHTLSSACSHLSNIQRMCTHVYHAATHCNTLQHTATHCNTHCNTLQHTATHCNTLQHTAPQARIIEQTATELLMEVHVRWRIRESAPTTSTWWPWFMSKNSVTKEASQLTRPHPAKQLTEYVNTHGYKGREGREQERKRRPRFDTDYLMATIYVKEFRDQGGVAVYKTASSETTDWLCKYTRI